MAPSGNDAGVAHAWHFTPGPRRGPSPAGAGASPELSPPREQNPVRLQSTPTEHEQEASEAPLGEGLGDPLVRALAHAPPGPLSPVVDAAANIAAPLSLPAPALTQLTGVERLLRRCAWGGDKTRGVARLEFGAGALAGSTLLIEADHGTLSLVLELPAGSEDDGWAERLRARLHGRGLSVSELVVR